MVNFDIKNGVRIIKETALDASTGPGIYKMIGDGDEVLYIGKAKNLAKRIQQYGDIQKLPNRLKKMVSMVMKIETLLTTNEVEALLLEANLIKSTLPRFNILLKDDKRFPYIVIEEGHEFPRISKYRGIKKSSGMCYYGPFADSGNSQSNVAELQKIFLVRSCTNSYFKARKRPCLLYQIKRCSAPCVGKITHEEYKKSIKQLKAFFSGKGSDIQGELLSAMKEASAKLNFEKAALIRDRIRLLSKIQNRSNLSALNLQIKHLERSDIFAVYYNNCFI